MSVYSYYGSGRVPALRFLYQMRYAVGVYDHAMRGAVTERIADRYAVGVKAIRTDLRLPDHTPAQVVQEVHGGLHVSLADAPTDDRLLRPGHRNENVLIALGVDLMAQDVLLLFADE